MTLLENTVDHQDGAKVVGASFFDRPAEKVAYDLIGCCLHWKIVTESEAYVGPVDMASHAAKGRTKRNEVMFGPTGSFYVYFIYGMHWMLNVVTGPIGYPAAVLIRSVEGITGPGRLTKALGITGKLNGRTASQENGIWFSQEGPLPQREVICSKRIGVEYAGPIWSRNPYRFNLETRA